MTDELITAIGHIGALKVISRTSVMHYKGSKKTIPDIARELRVDAVLQGSVMRSGDRIRITAQLTDGVSDHNLWGQSYERPVQDVLALQDEVARSIAGEIRVRLPAQRSAGVSGTRTVNPTAHEAYLKGRYHLAKWTPEGYQRAGQFFQQAIAEDPSYAEAYAGLADSHALLGYYGVIAPKDAFPRAKAAALKALELNDSLSEAHTSLALITDNFEWQWARGEQEFKRAHGAESELGDGAPLVFVPPGLDRPIPAGHRGGATRRGPGSAVAGCQHEHREHLLRRQAVRPCHRTVPQSSGPGSWLSLGSPFHGGGVRREGHVCGRA